MTHWVRLTNQDGPWVKDSASCHVGFLPARARASAHSVMTTEEPLLSSNLLPTLRAPDHAFYHQLCSWVLGTTVLTDKRLLPRGLWRVWRFYEPLKSYYPNLMRTHVFLKEKGEVHSFHHANKAVWWPPPGLWLGMVAPACDPSHGMRMGR
jgi:hypothetical protein